MDDVHAKPVNQGWSAAWLAAKFLLSLPILGVVCAAFVFALGIVVENMTDVCPRGFHVGHFPCDVSLLACMILLLIIGLGIWLLLWIVRLETVWNRFQPWFARNARKWHARLSRRQ
jgi:hypothetical protein